MQSDVKTGCGQAPKRIDPAAAALSDFTGFLRLMSGFSAEGVLNEAELSVCGRSSWRGRRLRRHGD